MPRFRYPGGYPTARLANPNSARNNPGIPSKRITRDLHDPSGPLRGLDADRLCLILGDDVASETEAASLDAQLRRSRLRVKRATQLTSCPELALVVVSDAVGPDALSDLAERLGGAERLAAIFVASGPGAAMEDARSGADGVLSRPLDAKELRLRFFSWWRKRHVSRAERARAGGAPEAGGLIGSSPAMREVLALIERVSGTDSNVLITGETGTGKELVSHAIHLASRRRRGPFVAVNLAAVPETLIESEIFGHEAGAFTGAVTTRPGQIELAQNGTLFLDEVGDLPLPAQVKLLRVLQEREFTRLGGTQTHRANFRLICATHRDLESLVRLDKFREDLLFRLDVIRIRLPPLRERGEDIVHLATHFVQEFSVRHQRPGLRLTDAALDAIKRHSWPGNVRELQHAIERAVILGSEGGTLGPEHLQPRPKRVEFVSLAREAVSQGRGLDQVLLDIERIVLTETMARFGQNQTAAAKHLKLNRQTLRHRLQRHGLL